MILNLCHFCHVDCELYLKSGSKAITPENFFGILLYEVVTIIYTYVFVYVLTYSHHFLEQNSKQIKYLDGKERKQNYDGSLVSTFGLTSGTKVIIHNKKATLFYIFDMDN